MGGPVARLASDAAARALSIWRCAVALSSILSSYSFASRSPPAQVR